MTLGGRRGVGVVAASAVLLAGLSTPAMAAARPRVGAHTLVASTTPATIDTSSMSVTGFQYAGLTAIPVAGGGTVPVLTFNFSSASMTGFSLAVPCHLTGGFNMQFDLAVAPAATAVSPGPMTIYATELDYSTADTTIPAPPVPPFKWIVAAPPPTHLLAGDTGTLTGVKVSLVLLDAPLLTLNSLRSTSSFC